MSSCNHVYRLEGEILLNVNLTDRVNNSWDHEFVWLRRGENSDGYELCPNCESAVRGSKHNPRHNELKEKK